jgi:hypothetical protein
LKSHSGKAFAHKRLWWSDLGQRLKRLNAQFWPQKCLFKAENKAIFSLFLRIAG